jgi:hypothetical protein
MFITTARVGQAGVEEQQRDYRVHADSAGAGSYPDQPRTGSHHFATACSTGRTI